MFVTTTQMDGTNKAQDLSMHQIAYEGARRQAQNEAEAFEMALKRLKSEDAKEGNMVE